MTKKKKCKVCKKTFVGNIDKIYCGKDCKLYAKRKRKQKKKRNEKSVEERRKETNRKYYLKNKYLLTKKYGKEQKIKNRKEKEKEYSEEWTKKHKIKKIEYRRRTKRKEKGWFEDYKKTLKCEICGYNNCPEALDFHHKNGENKEFNITKGFYKFGKEKILEEIEKCVVLCSNCHRELHYRERQEGYRKRRQEYLKIIKEEEKPLSLFYYKIAEKEFETDWFKELKKKAKYNLDKFGANQFIKRDNGIKEKIDMKMILSKKVGIPQGSIKKCIQIYNRGTEEQKKRAREGIDTINKIYKELKPIRNSKNVRVKYKD